MLTRREILDAAAAGALASICVKPLALAAGAAPDAAAEMHVVRSATPTGLYAAVFEERSSAARVFAHSAAAAGIPTRSIRGDVTDLWYRELYPLWRLAAVPLAGLTAYGTLFCLEQLAWDHRMRLVQLGTHRLARGRALGHTLQGPLAPLVRTGLRSASGWSAALATGIARIDAGSGWRGLPPASRCAAIEHRIFAGSHRRADERLYSWVIA